MSLHRISLSTLKLAGLGFILLSATFFPLASRIVLPGIDRGRWIDWQAFNSAALAFWSHQAHWPLSDWPRYENVLRAGGVLTSFEIHAYLPFFLAAALMGFGLFIALQDDDASCHIRGPRLYRYGEAVTFAKRWAKRSGKEMRPGLQIHPEIRLPSAMDCLGALFLGSPGAGKTQISCPRCFGRSRRTGLRARSCSTTRETLRLSCPLQLRFFWRRGTEGRSLGTLPRM
jgi:hypothetical protein